MEQAVALASLHQSLHRSDEFAEILRRSEALMPQTGEDRDPFTYAWCWLVGWAKQSARRGEGDLLDAMEQALRAQR